ncbi:hypothetical protein GCM10023189_22250 [Nibrella saemangeumensis]|uniref:UbiA prenyltransferase family protein n=2 Tax=Nibrella saemangeumensis TaxID=1084526 RepID=A0ABP8MRP0_9BACT
MAVRLSDAVVPVHWATTWVLALVVFIIYTVDRLLDVRKPDMLPTARHTFHRRHAPVLWRVVAGAAGLALLLAIWLPGSVIKFGLVLGVLCAAYVAMVFRLPARHPALLAKEPLVALFFTAGVWGSVWVQRPSVSAVEWAQALMFLAIAFQNLLLFSVLELQEQLTVPQFSLATYWGPLLCDQLMRWLTFLVVGSSFFVCFTVTDRFAQRSALIQAIMSLVLYVIQRHPAYFLKNERYRWIGDGVFWLPALVL